MDFFVRKQLISAMLVFFALLFPLALPAAEQYNKNFSFELRDVTVKDVFRYIEKNSEYVFLYASNKNLSKKVNVDVKDKNVKQILDEVLEHTGLVYEIDGKQIIVKEQRTSTPTDRQQSTLQQTKKVYGVVKDESGETIIGANVWVKDTTTGVITDIDGRYQITLNNAKATLVFSYLGMKTQEIVVGDKSEINVVLMADAEQLDEVVVVGYGTQKKVNLTGSVASVDSKKLSERPTANVASLLQGQVSGLEITQNTGQPGNEGTSMQVRGMGTFSSAGTAPMVLVDGVAGSLSALSPNEIESVSVLKDAASAAIYGARAANGVILVTTKNGQKGKMQLSYHVNTAWQQATVLPELITSSVEYMEMYNQMADRVAGKRKYSEEYIDLYRDPNRNKLLYPDYDWINETFKTGFSHNHSVTASGGSDKVLYNINFSYLNQEGILPGHGYERFTGRSNVEAQVHERVKIGAKVAFYNGNVEAPAYQNDGYLLLLIQQRPMYMPYLPDGSGRYTYTDLPLNQAGEFVNRNPLYIANETHSNTEKWRWDAQAYLNIDLLKKENMSLAWNSKIALSYSDSFNKRLEPNDGEGYYYHPLEAGADYTLGSNFNPERSGVKDSYSKGKQLTLFTTFDYNINVGNHDMGVLLGYSQESYDGRSLNAYRKWFPSSVIEELDGGSTLDQTLGGNSSDWGLLSLFGRMNYSYAGKYLFEANFRYDGSSRIYKDGRWGLFPSFSAAWRISEENFIKDNCEWMNNLKLRISWGKLGNQSIGNYAYHDIYDSSNIALGGEQVQAMNQNKLVDKSLTWEETAISDIGIDFNLWNDKLYATIDWYNKVTSGILNQAPIPASVGLGAPTINYGKLRNRGVEIQVGHRNQVRDFNYGVSFMASFNKNEVLDLLAPSYGNYINEVGLPYGEHYMWEWIGLFQSEEEIASAPKHPYTIQPGDLKLKDQNDDGVIDGEDRIVVSGKYPKMVYSFNVDMAYKNVDLTLFFQGVEGRKIYTHTYLVEPFAQGAPPTVEFRDAWTPENRDTNIPALYGGIPYYKAASNRSTYFLRDASYLRLKNLQLGYNFPKQWISKVGLKSLRLYFSGENLFTITDYPHSDPERASDGRHAVYPQLKTYSVGLDVKF